MPPRTTRKSYRLRASDRTMVGTLQPHCLSHQKPKASSRQQHDSAKKRKPQEPPNITWAGEPGKNLCSFQSPGSFSLDSPLYRTRLASRGLKNRGKPSSGLLYGRPGITQQHNVSFVVESKNAKILAVRRKLKLVDRVG